MSGTPGDVTADDFTSLSEAIEAADSATAAGIYTISLDAASGTIDLTGMIPEISLASGVTLDIIGNGTTLDGGGAEPGLFAYQGNVSIDDLTLLNTTITGGEAPHGANRGGTGYAGYGGGSAGLGGGLFIGSKAAVTLDRVNFTNDDAIGGNGGPGGQGATNTGRAGFGQGGSGGNQGSPFDVGGNGFSGGFGGGGGGGGGGGSGYFYYDDGKGGGTIAGDGGAGGKGGFGAGSGAAGNYGATVIVSLEDHRGTSTNASGTHVYTYMSRVMSGTPNLTYNGGGAGGGGLGAGGDIFVQGGGKLKILGGSLGAGTVKGGSGANPGSSFGSGIFLQGNEAAVLAADAGKTLIITGVIADEDGSESGYSADKGTIAIEGPGTVLLDAANTFEGGIILSGGRLLLGAAGAAGGGGITFTNDPTMAFTAADAPSNTISGFAPGDVIDITDLKESSVQQSFAPGGDGGVLTLTGTQIGSNDPETVRLNFSGTSGDFHLEQDAGGGTEIAICYLRGTRLLTPEGPVTVENLDQGDLLVTRFGGVRRIKWIGRQRYAWRRVLPGRRPIRICAGALAPGLPSRDLLVSPGHSMLLGDQLVLAETLVNGVTVRRELAPPAEDMARDYFQVEFETHDCVLAEGAWSETYADAPGLRAQFHNAAEYAALYPDDPPARELILCAPRPERGEKLEAALRPVVARAAAQVTPSRLEGFIEGLSDWEVRGWALDAAHTALPVLLEIVQAGEVLGTVLACEDRDDLRSAAKGGGRCAFTFHAPRRLRADGLMVRRASDGAELGFSASRREVA